MTRTISRKADGEAAPASRDDLRRVVGELEDATTLEMLALDPTVTDLEEAMIWAECEDHVLSRTGRPPCKAARVFDILTRDEEPTQAPSR